MSQRNRRHGNHLHNRLLSASLIKWQIAFRLTRVGLHLVYGVLTVFCLYPLLSRTWRLRLKQRWSRQLLDIFGITLQIRGHSTGNMRVANHISWLDIFVINAVTPSAFVAKADVQSWPLIGWLSTRSETIFIRRNSRRAAHAASHELVTRLRSGIEIVGFPEGTTSDGRQVLPFHGALLQAAIVSDARIQPIALRYTSADGCLVTAPAYYGEITLLQSMARLAATRGMHAVVTLLPERAASGYERRDLANELRSEIVGALCAATA